MIDPDWDKDWDDPVVFEPGAYEGEDVSVVMVYYDGYGYLLPRRVAKHTPDDQLIVEREELTIERLIPIQ